MVKKFKEIIMEEYRDFISYTKDNLRRVPKVYKQGLFALGLVGILYGSMNSSRKIYPIKGHSRYINAMKVDYRENVGFLFKKNVLKLEIGGNKYVFYDSKDETFLDWDNKEKVKSNELLEKVVLTLNDGKSYTFRLEDISSDKMKGLYALHMLSKSDSLYNFVRDKIANIFRSDYDEDMKVLESGFNPKKSEDSFKAKK